MRSRIAPAFAVITLLAVAAPARGQGSNGFVFVAPGAVTNGSSGNGTLQYGVGGEGMIAKGFGAMFDIGALSPIENFGETIGILSVDGSYHFRRGRGRMDPFAAAGYTLLFRSGHANLFNFGGGFNYWFHRHLALRVEFRDHIWNRADVHYLGVRFGLAFR